MLCVKSVIDYNQKSTRLCQLLSGVVLCRGSAQGLCEWWAAESEGIVSECERHRGQRQRGVCSSPAQWCVAVFGEDLCPRPDARLAVFIATGV